MGDETWQLPEAMRPPPDVTRALFEQWCEARYGEGNPERMTNPVWVWLARQPEVSAYRANRHFGGARPRGAVWTNQRFGQSTTLLPDGRMLAVGGEHEDGYDPDFFIYNDVIVTAPDGGVEISEHLATATSDGSRIAVTGGQCEIARSEKRFLRETIDDFELELATMTWKRLTDRRWSQFELARADERIGGLWNIEQLAYHLDRPDDAFDVKQAAYHREQLGREPDLEAWRSRFRPPVAHDVLPAAREEWRFIVSASLA